MNSSPECSSSALVKHLLLSWVNAFAGLSSGLGLAIGRWPAELGPFMGASSAQERCPRLE